MQAYELNFDSTDFESFNDRKGRVATLPWKTTDEFFVIKTPQEMNHLQELLQPLLDLKTY